MSSWPVENKGEIKNKFILFLISPFISFLYSLKNMNTKSSFVVFFFFAICFGMAFSVQPYESKSLRASGIDAGRYRLSFEKSVNMSSKEFFRDAKDFFQFDEGERDFYFISMVFLVSRFTNNYHWLFTAFAIVFAFFQLKSLRFLVDNKNWENTLFCLLIALFFTWNQLFNINAMRFFTAAWIGVFCVFQIFLNDRKRYFILLLLTPFFHSSFWLVASVIILAYLLKNLEWVWITFYIAVFFSSTIFIDVLLNQVIDLLPGFLSPWVQAYLSEDRLFEDSTFSGSGFWWVPMLFDRLYKIYVNILIVLMIVNRKEIRATCCKNLYRFVIVFMTFVNFGMVLPQIGTRCILMAYPIIAYIWLSVFGNNKYQWLIYAFPFIWMFQIMTYLKYYGMVLDWTFFISSPFIMIIKYLIIG